MKIPILTKSSIAREIGISAQMFNQKLSGRNYNKLSSKELEVIKTALIKHIEEVQILINEL